MKKVLKVVCFFLVFISHASFATKQTVLFVNPSVVDDPFWQKVQSISQHAAEQLGFEMQVIYGEGNRHIQIRELKKYLQYQKKPDFAVLILYPGGAFDTLDTLEKFQVPTLTLEQTISGEEKILISEPGIKFKHWLGEVYHDNYKAGYSLAKALHEKSPQQKMHKAVLINGHYGSESDMRAKGALDYFKANKIEVAQQVYASWSKEQATEQTKGLINRHKNISIIWAASDLMAIGAQDACSFYCSEKQKVSIGGFDWLSLSLEKIASGELNASVGGHFMMGAWALVSFYDYQNKHPYWLKHKNLIIPMGVINQDNVKSYQWMKEDPNWGVINYKAKSLVLNKQDEYQLDLIPKIWKKN